MALGYNENEASGLIVWNMVAFNHPPGFSVDHKCNEIYCTWFNDAGAHRDRASDTEGLYKKLRENGAVEVGSLAPMDCEGNCNEILTVVLQNKIIFFEHFREM